MVFYGHHGVTDPEREVGKRYEVDVIVETGIAFENVEESLRKTIDYGKIYMLTAEVLQRPRKLLETLAHEIAVRLLEALPPAQAVQIRVSKIDPPVGGICHRAFVAHRLERKTTE
jgi:dihydroneopterin aldolase